MADTVWHRVDRELARRKGLHLSPGTWAALGRAINVTAQVLTNWKSRRVPPEMHAAIAQALSWTVDQLLGNTAFEFVDSNAVIRDSLEERQRIAASPEATEEADLLSAFRRLPSGERQELVRDVMARAEVLDEMVGRYLREKHNVTGFASSSLVSENIDPAPTTPPAPRQRGTRIEDRVVAKKKASVKKVSR